MDRRTHLTALMSVFTAGMMSSKVRSLWWPFSSLPSSTGQSADGRAQDGSEDTPLFCIQIYSFTQPPRWGSPDRSLCPLCQPGSQLPCWLILRKAGPVRVTGDLRAFS